MMGLSALSLDPLSNVFTLLARAELDDAHLRQAVFAERIVSRDLLDLLSTGSHGDDNAAVAWNLAAGDQKVARCVILLEELHVGAHVRIDFGQWGLVTKLDDEHGN